MPGLRPLFQQAAQTGGPVCCHNRTLAQVRRALKTCNNTSSASPTMTTVCLPLRTRLGAYGQADPFGGIMLRRHACFREVSAGHPLIRWNNGVGPVTGRGHPATHGELSGGRPNTGHQDGRAVGSALALKLARVVSTALGPEMLEDCIPLAEVVDHRVVSGCGFFPSTHLFPVQKSNLDSPCEIL